MQDEDVEKKLRQQHFKPFRVFLTDGSMYEVRHPEMVLLGRCSMVIGVALDPDQKRYDRAVDFELSHVVRMDYIEPLAPTKGQ